MSTILTKQIIKILAELERPVLLNSLFRMQTATKHEARLGLLLRDLEDKRLINSINTSKNFYIQYQITPTGMEYYENEVKQ